jgi:DNA-binding NarL/FixJ family response regulator
MRGIELTKVLLVDESALVRTGLATLIAATKDVRVVGEASNGAQAVEAVAEKRPDVVVMDVVMPVMDGIAATRVIRNDHPDVLVLVLTLSQDRAHVSRALDAGAIGYVLKDAQPANLLEAIRTVARGQSPLDPRVARTLLHERRVARGSDLSVREREVLFLLARGHPNRSVAARLGVQEATVKTHLTRIYRQIGVRNRRSAALWVQQNLEREEL